MLFPWPWPIRSRTKMDTYLAHRVRVRAGDVEIEADDHGRAFQVTINGVPITKLRRCVLTLDYQQAGTVEITRLISRRPST
jgi:hypothetical protein